MVTLWQRCNGGTFNRCHRFLFNEIMDHASTELRVELSTDARESVLETAAFLQQMLVRQYVSECYNIRLYPLMKTSLLLSGMRWSLNEARVDIRPYVSHMLTELSLVRAHLAVAAAAEINAVISELYMHCLGAWLELMQSATGTASLPSNAPQPLVHR